MGSTWWRSRHLAAGCSRQDLETALEEVQSRNEELETMNAKRQASNEALQAANEQLRATSTAVDLANPYLSSILESLEAGVAVLDDALRERPWNVQAEDLGGVRADEVIGQPFLPLDSTLPVAELEGFLRTALGGESSPEAMRVDAVNRRERSIVCRVTGSPLPSQSGGILGMTLLMEHWTDSGGDPGSGRGGH